MIRKSVFFFACLMSLASGFVWGAENLDPFQEYAENSRRKFFVVETDEDSARSSLDRISGNIDRGFASEEYTYKSRNHGTHGPLQDQKDETLHY